MREGEKRGVGTRDTKRSERLIAHRIQMRKGVSCQVLESRRKPSLQVGYDRVRAWVSREHGGIIYAEAYNAAGKKTVTESRTTLFFIPSRAAYMAAHN